MVGLGLLAAPHGARAIEPGADYPADLRAKMFSRPELSFTGRGVPVSTLSTAAAAAVQPALGALGARPQLATVDPRSGRFASLVLATPLVPGPGAGNRLSWVALGMPAPADDAAYEQAVWRAFSNYLTVNASALGVPVAQLEAQPNVAAHDHRRLAHVWADRVVDGVPVRGASISATLNSGNLVLLNLRNWGAIDVPTRPSVSKEVALSAVSAHAAPYSFDRPLLPTSLTLVAATPGGETPALAAATGYRYRLAWVVTVLLEGQIGTWEALVDAHSGELLSFTDVNHYADPERKTVGAILPFSNDGLGPEGVEQPAHPMPYLTLTRPDGSNVTTSDSGLAAFSGAYSTDLTGPYVSMADACGPILESTTCTDLDLGGNAGTDCATPPGASPGNTRSSRTGFYELNRLVELWRSRAAPGEGAFAFLNGVPTPVQSNMNIENACNAFFTPALPSINFYRYGTIVGSSGRPSTCRNTGEIAAVFDHEYGHYLDFMDGNAMSSSSEGYADVVSILRLNDSCVGRGFYILSAGSTNPNNPNPFGTDKCGGDGDFCRTCTGVREADWMKRRDQAPHGVDWVNGVDPRHPASGCRAGAPNPPTPPAPGLSGTPCGSGFVHCEGQLTSESVVDLYTRDLRCHGRGWEAKASQTGNDVNGGRCVGDVAPTMSEATALEIATQLFSAAKGNVQAWFECSNQFGGCNADSGFHQFLAADDDNGNLLDGTPHGVAIFDAFARHQIACPLIGALVKNAGCGLANPRGIRDLRATAGAGSIALDWADEAGATEYWVFRTEGVRGCATGKARIATLVAGVDGSRYTDSGLLPDFPYAYSVMAVGAPGCTSEMSECVTAEALPTASAVEQTPSIALRQDAVQVLGGDGDEFLDNCETLQVGFTVVNDGNVSFGGAQVTAIRPLSHPATVVRTPLPISLGTLSSECGGATAGAAPVAFEAAPKGLQHGEALVFAVDVRLETAAGPIAQTRTVTIGDVETDPFVLQSEVVFDFEDGAQGWTTASGEFARTDATPGGAPASGPAGTPTAFYMASSRTVDSACDRLRSPAVRLTPTSTLALFDQFVIEPTSDAVFDRANVGLVDAASGVRTVISPSGGRTYTVEGGDGVNPDNRFCTENQAGWNGPGPGWLESSWTAGDLGAAAAAGHVVHVDVASATDGTAAALGLMVDQVRLTDVYTRGADQAADNCAVPVAVADAYTVAGQILVVPPRGVLANDSDADGDTITAALVTAPSQGDVDLRADGSFVYSRPFGFTGTDSFTYQVTDGVHRSAPVTVTLQLP